MKISFWKFISIVIMCTIIGFIFGLIASSRAEAASYTSISIGNPPEKGDWVQGVEASPSGLYVMDGTVIKKIAGKKVTTYFDVKDLKSVMPAHLKYDAVMDSFLLSQMTYHGGRLYVSGLVYKDTQSQNKTMNHQKVAGETHAVLFSVRDKKPHVIHTSLSYHNKSHQFGDFYETKSELPKNMWSTDDGLVVVAFGKHVNKPRFTITEKNEVIFAVQREGEPPELHMDVYQYKNKESKLFYSQQVYEDQHFIPTLKNKYLTVYYEINNQYDDYNIRTIHVESKKESKKMVPDDLLLEKPLEINGEMHFLNEDGVFKVVDEGRYMNMKWILKAKEIPLSVWITGWDYDGKHVYLADFDRRVILKVKP